MPRTKNGHIVYSWQLIPGAEEAIYNKISDICVSMKAKDYLQLPPRTENIIELDLNPTSWKQYKELEREYVLELEETDVVASNAATLSNKLYSCLTALYTTKTETEGNTPRKVKCARTRYRGRTRAIGFSLLSIPT